MLKLPARLIFSRSPQAKQTRYAASSTPDWPKITNSQESSSDALADVVSKSAGSMQGPAASGSKRETLVSFTPNSVYNPQDFLRSRRTASDPRRIAPPSVGPDAKTSLDNDTFRYLGVEPRREANNKNLLRNFMTGMAKILPRSKTNLSWRSQRMVAQAIKRAKQKGIIPVSSNPDWHKKT